MSKRHGEIFDDVLSDLGEPAAKREGGSRFLRRQTTLAERASGTVEEKTLRWVDPATCRMWDRHNRDYARLNENNCADLIEGFKAQGQQEFPAIVRRLSGEDQDYEVICGARRHWTVSWLRANTYPQFKFLIDVRDLTDEEAFRLADVENRDRADISDHERARDYAEAIRLYYGGKQKTMAERLQVAPSWLSRYLDLARLPDQIVAAYATPADILEVHARKLKPLLADHDLRAGLLSRARGLAKDQEAARQGKTAPIDGKTVLARLLKEPKSPAPKPSIKTYSVPGSTAGVTFRKTGKTVRLEFPDTLRRAELGEAFNMFMNEHFPPRS